MVFAWDSKGLMLVCASCRRIFTTYGALHSQKFTASRAVCSQKFTASSAVCSQKFTASSAVCSQKFTASGALCSQKFGTGTGQPLLLRGRRFHVSASSRLAKAKVTLTEANKGRKRLVILGSGWGGYSVLKSIDKRRFDVQVVSPRNYFLFTPLLCSTTVGTLEFRSIIEPIRNHGFRDSAHFHLAYSTDLDLEKKSVKVTSVLRPSLTYDLTYDKLVIGVGALSNTFGVPGVEEHASFLKEIHDARKIRNRILSNFELALQPGIEREESDRLLHVVIVGGGPTGVEFGAELYDFIEQDVARLYRKQQEQVKVTLIESKQILSSFDDRLQKYAEKKMFQRKRFHLLQTSVIEVTDRYVKVVNGDIIPCGLVVWSTGLAPHHFTKAISVEKNSRGQIVTDGYLRIRSDPSGDVYAIGDCADIDGYPLPCTAQVAERQGLYLASFLNKDCPSDFQQFCFKSMGMLAYIGGFEALTDTPMARLHGFHSWLLWRSAYLTRLGSWRLRMQVPLDWTKTLFFGRDISRFE